MTIQIIPSGTETAEQYRASGAWGSTLINTFITCPRLAHEILAGRYVQPETAAMRFGSRFHALMDSGSGFTERSVQAPDVDRRTKAWSAAESAATAAGKDLIPYDDWIALHRMRESALANPYARSLLEGAEHEVGFRMDAPQGGFRVQCRADVLHRWSHLADLKTTTDLNSFTQSVTAYGYHRQAFLYSWTVSHLCGGELLPFTFIVVEKNPPLYRCRVIDLSPGFLQIGRLEVEAALADIGRRVAANDWTDPVEHAVIEPPAWLRREGVISTGQETPTLEPTAAAIA